MLLYDVPCPIPFKRREEGILLSKKAKQEKGTPADKPWNRVALDWTGLGWALPQICVSSNRTDIDGRHNYPLLIMKHHQALLSIYIAYTKYYQSVLFYLSWLSIIHHCSLLIIPNGFLANTSNECGLLWTCSGNHFSTPSLALLGFNMVQQGLLFSAGDCRYPSPMGSANHVVTDAQLRASGRIWSPWSSHVKSSISARTKLKVNSALLHLRGKFHRKILSNNTNSKNQSALKISRYWTEISPYWEWIVWLRLGFSSTNPSTIIVWVALW